MRQLQNLARGSRLPVAFLRLAGIRAQPVRGTSAVTCPAAALLTSLFLASESLFYLEASVL